MKPGKELMARVRQAFLDFGYGELSMVGMARACGFTRRALYNYFSSKEEAFRASIRYENEEAILSGLAAGQRVRRHGGSALDILAEIMNVRYGFTRRSLNVSPHTVELNAEAFRRCRDIMIEVAVGFQREIETLIVDLDAEGMLRLNGAFTPAQMAQMLADGARAVNQGLPPIPSEELAGRYRAMCQGLLYGMAEQPVAAARPTSRHAG